ncbi:Cof-type HAD-IIB family hydrolase [Gracilibacillus timonensis]|uniref:Cof-type HAD-IIB family hydrolase n=1 Tax=Gracilibacillus timonensis TaxID=1816696 RepID=UPI0037097C63
MRQLEQKIVFLDIDDTILDHRKQIPQATRKAVEQLHNNGVIVSIATGRAPFMIQDILKELQISSHITFNGQHVVHNNEIIYRNPIDSSVVQALTTFSMENDHPLVYQSDHDMRSNVSESSFIEKGMNSLKLKHPLIDEDYYNKHDIFQVLLFNEKSEQGAYEDKFDQLRFVRWHEFSCDVLPGNGSKAHGIKEFVKILGIKWENTYAFGDGLNDIEMIESVHTGVAMGNAMPEVKKVADLITENVENNGLSRAMRQLGLID